MPAMGTGLASSSGEATPALLRYYEERAQGGAGAIVVEIACVDSPQGKASLTQLCIDRPEMLPGLAELADLIRSYQSLAFIQLHHAGRQTAPFVIGGGQPVAPSAKACRFMRVEPRPLEREEIAHIRNKYIAAAVMAGKAGFDGVELHAAHGYLLSQFLSPYTNLRQDEYGGSLENRFRLLREIMDGIKVQAPQLVLAVRFNLADFVEGGIDWEEGLHLAGLIESAGADLLNASCGIYESGQTSIETGSFSEGWRMDMIAQAKKAVNIPVLGGGVVRKPEMAARFIEEGFIDLVWIGRGMLADPAWARKALQGKAAEIRPCITCNTCFDTISRGHHIRCAVNPHTGREERMSRPAFHEGRSVLIAGGGPGGLQAALAYSQAGAKVILLEARDRLGGQMNAAQIPPGKAPIGRLQEYLLQEIQAAPVEVRLGSSLTNQHLAEIRPDVLVLATGSVPATPSIKGLASAYTAVDVLERKVSWENQHIMIIGGGSTGCEAADYLSIHNRVTLVEKESTLAEGMENMARLELLFRLKKQGVEFRKSTQLESVQGQEAVLSNIITGEATTIEFDYLLLAVGNRSQLPPLDAKLLPQEVYVIGDAREPRGFAQAFLEARMLVYCQR